MNPPDDSISCLRFSPPSVNNSSFLIAGSWDNNVRCWEIQSSGQSVPKTQQSMQVIIKFKPRSIWSHLTFTSTLEIILLHFNLNSNSQRPSCSTKVLCFLVSFVEENVMVPCEKSRKAWIYLWFWVLYSVTSMGLTETLSEFNFFEFRTTLRFVTS